MKLALVLGLQQGNAVKPRLHDIKDNLSIDCYNDIPNFIENSIKRSVIYDRVLLISTVISQHSAQELHSHWSKFCPNTNIVLLSRKGIDEKLAESFARMFSSPLIATMLVSSTTVHIIAEAVLRPAIDLNKDYGVETGISVELEDGVEIGYTDERVEEVSVEHPVEVEKSVKKKKKEKRTFLGSLFGVDNKKSSKRIEPTNKIDTKTKEEKDTVIEDEDTPNQTEVLDDACEEMQDPHSINAESEFEEQILTDDYDGKDTNSASKLDFDDSEALSINDTDGLIEDNEPIIEERTFIDDVKIEGNDENNNIIDETSSPNVDDDFDSGFIDETVETHKSFEEEISTGTDDIDDDISFIFEDVPITNKDIEEGADEVDDDLIDDVSSSAEEAYRKAEEEPRVVTKTVVKEVVRNIAETTALTALNKLYEGRANKVIIVTGDRGTGITSTALNLAMMLSKKVPILYFDCDIKNHGLLNYIDYEQFRSFEPSHMEGIKRCKNSKFFDRSVMCFDNNFDILTTDFSCDATVEELQTAQEIVAERVTDYGAVIVDCPVDMLQYLPDLSLIGNTVVCVEGSKRGFMNMLCRFEDCSLSTKFKRTIVGKGIMFVTKCQKDLDLKRLLSYIRAVFEPGDVDYFKMDITKFNGKLSDELVNKILEG